MQIEVNDKMNRILASFPSNINQKVITKKNGTKHVFIKGDCLDILNYFPNESIDLIITDPPYNMSLNYGSYYKDNLPKKIFFEQLEKRITEFSRVLSKNGSMYLISYPEINARLLAFIEENLKKSLIFRRWLTWHYPSNIGYSKNNFTRSQRSILFLVKSKKYTFHRERILQDYKNPDVKKIKELLKKGSKGRASYDLIKYSDLIEMHNKNPLDLLEFDLLKNVSKDRIEMITKFRKLSKNKGEVQHPCQLPLPLIELLTKVSSNENDIILDPFAGTFTTNTVAHKTNRNSIGIEINPKYIKLGEKRLKNG
jgi:DNA modification methylase